jgi:hypothetical protein
VSRVILTKHDTGEDHLVVGWDHAAGGAFWQEFNPEPDTDEGWVEWEEVARSGGMWPGLPLTKLRESMPPELRVHVTSDVLRLLALHRGDRDSGRRPPVDLAAHR